LDVPLFTFQRVRFGVCAYIYDDDDDDDTMYLPSREQGGSLAAFTIDMFPMCHFYKKGACVSGAVEAGAYPLQVQQKRAPPLQAQEQKRVPTSIKAVGAAVGARVSGHSVGSRRLNDSIYHTEEGLPSGFLVVAFEKSLFKLVRLNLPR
jgi:hypothetical protein